MDYEQNVQRQFLWADADANLHLTSLPPRGPARTLETASPSLILTPLRCRLPLPHAARTARALSPRRLVAQAG